MFKFPVTIHEILLLIKQGNCLKITDTEMLEINNRKETSLYSVQIRTRYM